MVRFIILIHIGNYPQDTEFTFQYGQIYYQGANGDKKYYIVFTFQYGQIYYMHVFNVNRYIFCIYIPIWLDLLLSEDDDNVVSIANLHSNMVRFIIDLRKKLKDAGGEFTFQYGQIYYEH